MADVKDLKTDDAADLCGQCKEKLVPRAKFCAMCAWAVPAPAPVPLDAILATPIVTTRLIYDADSLCDAKWVTTVGGAAHRVDNAALRTSTYPFSVCNLVARPWDLLLNTAECDPTRQWIADGTTPQCTWASMAAGEWPYSYPHDRHEIQLRGQSRWSVGSHALLHRMLVKHVYCVRDLRDSPRVFEKFETLLTELIDAKIETPRCGFTFEVESSIPWAKLTAWYAQTHPAPALEFKADSPLTITLKNCDEKYFETRAGILYDLDKTAGRVGVMTIEQISAHLSAATLGIRQKHKESSTAQATLDKLLTQLPLVLYRSKNYEGRFVYTSEKDMAAVLEPIDKLLKPVFIKSTIAYSTVFTATPATNALIRALSDPVTNETRYKGVELAEGATIDAVVKAINASKM